MNHEFAFLMTGVLLGTTAGFSPGPLLTLVISETLKHNFREGIKVASVPLITDLPVILAALFVLAQLSNINWLLGLISFTGALFLLYLAYENICFRESEELDRSVRPESLKKGIITNLLNPNPYLFWFSVGAPIVLKALHEGVPSALLFLAGFYLTIVGSKALIALLVGRFRSFLKSRIYLSIMRLLGVALLVFALAFILDGLKLLGLWG